MTDRCSRLIVKAKQGTDKLPCFCYYRTTSTNYLAQVFGAENRVENPVVIMAKSQTQGRGRYERSFLSPKGGLYMSYISPAIDGFPMWSVTSAVAVTRVLSILNIESTIKWPNDVKVGGKKICGILPESVVTDKRYVVIGIGVNVNTDLEDLEEVKDIATSVYAVTGKKISVKKFFKLLVKELHSIFTIEDSQAVLDEYIKKCETLSKEVVTQDGFIGVATNITEDGSLVVKGENEMKNINWGEICYVK